MDDDTPDDVPRRAVDRFTWERALRRSGVTGTGLGVLLTLGTFMNADGSNAHPGYPLLSAHTGWTQRCIGGHIRDAIESGLLIEVERGHRRGDGSVTASVFQASLPACGFLLTCSSTGSPVPVEDAQSSLYRNLHASLPERGRVSTGTPVPPTKSSYQENDSDPDSISEQHKAAAADGLRAYREAVGREAS